MHRFSNTQPESAMTSPLAPVLRGEGPGVRGLADAPKTPLTPSPSPLSTGAGGERSAAACLIVALLALLLPSCQQEMANQPNYRPLQPSSFFPDGRSARPLREGVVTRDQPLDGSPLVSGLVKGRKRVPAAGGEIPPAGAPDDPANYVSEFPFRVTEADLRRGQERFTIYCTPCHGPLGDGHGKVVERGYLQPPSYLTDDSRGFFRWGIRLPLRQAPVGFLFEVASRGYGGMPDYAEQIPPDDRWRIVAYVRALQLSGHAVARDLPPDERAAALRELGGVP